MSFLKWGAKLTDSSSTGIQRSKSEHGPSPAAVPALAMAVDDQIEGQARIGLICQFWFFSIETARSPTVRSQTAADFNSESLHLRHRSSNLTVHRRLQIISHI
jgi:hypothetical protein